MYNYISSQKISRIIYTTFTLFAIFTFYASIMQQLTTIDTLEAKNHFSNGSSIHGTTLSKHGARLIESITDQGHYYQQRNKVQSSDIAAGDSFGIAVRVSPDGQYFIAGAVTESANGTDAGAAYIFTRSGTSWTQQAKLLSQYATAGTQSGSDVAINANGEYAAVGITRYSVTATNAGAVAIFKRNDTTWTEQTLLEAGDPTASGFFGISIHMAPDASYLFVAASGTGGGAVYVFTRTNDTWTQQAKVQGSDTESGDSFGVAIHANGNSNMLAVSATGEDTGASAAGAVYVFSRSGSTWSQQVKITDPSPTLSGNFGKGVLLNEDADVLVIGSGDGITFNGGTISIYTRGGITWTLNKQIGELRANASAKLGNNMAISTDGTYIYSTRTLSGAPDEIIVYKRAGNTWYQWQGLSTSDIDNDDSFADISCSADGRYILVGVYNEDTGGTDAGAVYVFEAGPAQKMIAHGVQVETSATSAITIQDNVSVLQYTGTPSASIVITTPPYPVDGQILVISLGANSATFDATVQLQFTPNLVGFTDGTDISVANAVLVLLFQSSLQSWLVISKII